MNLDASRLRSDVEQLDRATAEYLAQVSLAVQRALGRAAGFRRVGGVVSDLEAASALEEMISDLFNAGGKLIRPRMVYLGFLAATLADAPDSNGEAYFPGALANAARGDVSKLGSAIELLHIFGLLQDDVMDEAATRRNAPTAHRRLAAQKLASRSHPGAATQSEGMAAARFGESLAVLAGDLAFALAQRQVRGMPGGVAEEWDDMVLELVQGQRLDIVYSAEGRADRDGTQWIAQAKSGAYSISRPLRLGALLAAPDSPVPDWLTRYGEHLGAAFALADDILGAWGDPSVTGKPVGDDLAQGKPTTVAGIASQRLSDDALRRPGPTSEPLTADETRRLLRAFEQAGVRTEAERQLSGHLDSALAAVDEMRQPALHSEFTRWATAIVARDR